MNETKFSPGPWKHEPVIRGSEVVRDMVVDADGNEVTYDVSTPDDAHLIASAPDLYAALEQIASLTPMRANSITAGDHHRKVKRMAEEALDKVRGK